MSLDPTVRLALRAALSLLLGSAAWHKLRDVGAFRAAVESYRLLPPVWAVPFAASLIAAESGLAIALWLPRLGGGAALGCAALLGLYATAMAITLRRGRRDVDCGCAGPAHRQSVRPALVVRNGVLIIAALLAALPARARSLTWVDVLTALLAPAAAACLYLAIDGLLANGPRLAALARLRRPEVPSG
ncbi:MAG TPA: MauE/DoxX family redox-associated membrane protein [Candidatus Dormibacteraeota bacterium]|nr:MauE/DoxX family redox-associated membrane protein [Candidatus Dormibacteraeota bacterium]